MTTQSQRESYLSLLILGCYLDGKHTLLETEEFDRITQEIEWTSQTACSLYASNQHAKARDLWDQSADVEKWVIEHTRAFKTPQEKSDLVDLVEQFLGRDGFSQEEAGFINRLRGNIFTH